MRYATPRRKLTPREQGALWFGAWLTLFLIAFAPVSV